MARRWNRRYEAARLRRQPGDYSHLAAPGPCQWYTGRGWRDGLLLEVGHEGGALLVGRHIGGEVGAFVVSDGRNVQQYHRAGRGQQGVGRG